jgi:hypothetical protein
VAGRRRAVVIVLAALPWTMRYGSETRMYLLVVVLVLAGPSSFSPCTAPAHAALSWRWAAWPPCCCSRNYGALFLLAAVGLLHLPGLVRRRRAAVRVGAGLVLGGVIFLPWLPTFLFRAAHTGTRGPTR